MGAARRRQVVVDDDKYCCTAGSSQRGMLKMKQTMCKFHCKREMAQINQTRDNLKTEYQSINIVQ
jgi:hypothetical protein